MPEWVDRLRVSPVIEDRTQHLIHSVRHSPPQGLLLEFGVFRGGSINSIAREVDPRVVWGFDTFTGLPEKWVRSKTSTYRLGHFGLQGKYPKVRANVRLIPGLFEDSLPAFLRAWKSQISFVNIDADLYSSCACVLALIEGRLLPGAIVYFDELVDWTNRNLYPNWKEGEHKALTEWAARTKYKVTPFSRNTFMGASVKVE